MANKPEHIIVHHTAVSRSKNDNQFDAVNNYHKSKGWGMIGYHIFIEPDGTIKGGRPENMPGAHCYQEGMNYKSIGICMTGNFDIEMPTQAQRESLKETISDLMEKYKIPKENVSLHRKYATYKSCPGRNMPDDIWEYLEDELTDREWCEKHLHEVEWDGIDDNLTTAFRALAMRGNEWWK